MATYERLDYGSADGAHFGGASTDKIGFYGATPVVRPAVTNTTTTTATTTALQADIDAIRAALRTLGLIGNS
jgi:hypothetical protein